MDFALDSRWSVACAVVTLVLVGIAILARLAPRRGLSFGADGRLLGIVESIFLPGAASLHVVRVADRYYVIGRSGSHVATLCEIPAETIARRHAAGRAPSFLSRLRRSRG